MPEVASRHVRAVTLAFASFGLGLGGHLQAGGHAGSPLTLLLAASWCAVSGWSYSHRRRSAQAVVSILLTNQVVIHLMLAIGSAMSLSAATIHAGCGEVQPSPEPTTAPPVATAAEHLNAAGMHDILPSGWMLMAHLLATAFTSATIVAVEALSRGLTAIADWLTRIVQVASGPVILLAPSTGPAAGTLPVWHDRPVGARPGRGPPELRISW